MAHGRATRILIATLAGGFASVCVALGLFYWSNSRVRVHSAEQAVELAREAHGKSAQSLPVRVEANQDFWIVRLGPDRDGQTHNYLVTIWDKRAGTVVEQTVQIDVDLGARAP